MRLEDKILVSFRKDNYLYIEINKMSSIKTQSSLVFTFNNAETLIVIKFILPTRFKTIFN